MGTRAYFVSDIHLENMQERNGQNLLRFLRYLAEQDETCDLYFLGDIFDLWLSDHKVFIKKFEPLLEPLRRLKQKGSRLVYFEGNHDMHLQPFWGRVMGFEMHTEVFYETIGSYRVRLEHGDLINLEDKAYLRLKAFNQSWFLKMFAHYLPGPVWNWVGKKLSENSRRRSRGYRVQNEENIRNMIRNHLKRAYQEESFDVMITGHMHVQLDEVVRSGEKIIRNINLGSWLESGHPPILCIEGSEIFWVTQ